MGSMRSKLHVILSSENQMEIRHLGDLEIDVTIIKWILKK
jgi:hypothetical protein